MLVSNVQGNQQWAGSTLEVRYIDISEHKHLLSLPLLSPLSSHPVSPWPADNCYGSYLWMAMAAAGHLWLHVGVELSGITLDPLPIAASDLGGNARVLLTR